LCFFFQAEDGIRDLVRSRGLGDVYKRQVIIGTFAKNLSSAFLRRSTAQSASFNFTESHHYSASASAHRRTDSGDIIEGEVEEEYVPNELSSPRPIEGRAGKQE